MKKVFGKAIDSIKHLEVLHKVFLGKKNYGDKNDHLLYVENLKRVSEISEEINFYKELYSETNRQMKLADIIEYIFFSRGIFSLINGKNQLIKNNIPKFIELVLRFVNLLMLYEIMTVDTKIRKVFLNDLKKKIKDIVEEEEFDKLLRWNKWVGLKGKDNPQNAPSSYFDSILPKTVGGLWHEMLVYVFILRFDIGYIFPLLLHQKIISLNEKLSPPDLVILHKPRNNYYGIEIGALKERQSGGFMVPSGIPVIPLDTKNCRISDRCPGCKKWIGICSKVIEDFSNPDCKITRPEIRCLYDCDKYTLKEKIDGNCSYMKYYNKSNNRHYHYKCVIKNEKSRIISDIKAKHHIEKKDFIKMLKDRKIKNLSCDVDSFRSKKINYLKTHYLWYSELSKLIQP